jgi:hypothetical protein
MVDRVGEGSGGNGGSGDGVDVVPLLSGLDRILRKEPRDSRFAEEGLGRRCDWDCRFLISRVILPIVVDDADEGVPP